jgi:endonuclease-3
MARAKGTYSLFLGLKESNELIVGALGKIEFPAGYYAYTGSAFGSGGFARLDRHHRVHSGENQTRHWHIDYVLPHVEILDVYRTAGIDKECELAGRLPGTPIPEFGSSDCSCHSHLQYTPHKHRLKTALRNEYGP